MQTLKPHELAAARDLAKNISTDTLRESSGREEIANANEQALIAVVAETGIILNPGEALNWRPTKRVDGYIPGIDLGLTIVATDGLLGLYIVRFNPGHEVSATTELTNFAPTGRLYQFTTPPSGVVSFVGHTQWFSGKVEPLYSWTKPKHGETKTKPKVVKNVESDATKRRKLLESI